MKSMKTFTLLVALMFAHIEANRLAQEFTGGEQIDLKTTVRASAQKEKMPFRHPVMETVGTVLMFILIALSNAGGLSGAGSNIPIMLIFFELEMHEAVPISAFVAVCATVYRFFVNFSQKHPNDPKRNCINYEVVEITMPFVFLGSFYGVQLGAAVGQTAQVCVFGITVAWSIKTTIKRACALLEQERQAARK